MSTDNLFERFMDRVLPEPNSGCWLWDGATDGRYGELSHRGKVRKAHRISWEIANQRPFPAGLNACHRCDIPLCVNPDHIWPGTQRDNIRDAASKGRMPHPGRFGSQTNSAKLTVEQAISIKKDNRGCRRLAREYGVDPRTIKRIRSGVHWQVAIQMHGEPA